MFHIEFRVILGAFLVSGVTESFQHGLREGQLALPRALWIRRLLTLHLHVCCRVF